MKMKKVTSEEKTNQVAILNPSRYRCVLLSCPVSENRGVKESPPPLPSDYKTEPAICFPLDKSPKMGSLQLSKPNSDLVRTVALLSAESCTTLQNISDM